MADERTRRGLVATAAPRPAGGGGLAGRRAMADRRGDAFQTALDEARRKDRAPDDGEAEPGKRPRVGVGVPLGGRRVRAERRGSGWLWTGPTNPRSGRRRNRKPSRAKRPASPADTSAEIATELGLGDGGPDARVSLTSRWRRFVWRNHPDRQPPSAASAPTRGWRSPTRSTSRRAARTGQASIAVTPAAKETSSKTKQNQINPSKKILCRWTVA